MTLPGKYSKKDERYEDKPINVKHREERNLARRQFKEAGAKGLPGDDIAHIKPLSGGGANTRANERLETVARNRGWRKGESGYTVPVDVKRKKK